MTLSNFHAGFADELVKAAGIRDVVKRIVHGKPVPKMGFFEKRRLAKALGVKRGDVEQTLMERQRKDRLTKALVAGGGLGVGTVMGGALDKEADAYMTMPRSGASPRSMQSTTAVPKPPGPTPDETKLMARRDALIQGRAGIRPTAAGPGPTDATLIARRDALLKKREDLSLMARRDDLLKKREAVMPPTSPKPPALAQR